MINARLLLLLLLLRRRLLCVEKEERKTMHVSGGRHSKRKVRSTLHWALLEGEAALASLFGKAKGRDGEVRRVRLVFCCLFFCSIFLFLLLCFRGFGMGDTSGTRGVTSIQERPQCKMVCATTPPCKDEDQHPSMGKICSVANQHSNFLSGSANASTDILAVRIEVPNKEYCTMTSSKDYQNFKAGRDEMLVVYSSVVYYVGSGYLDRPLRYDPSSNYVDQVVKKALDTTSLAIMERPSALVLGLGCGKSAHLFEELFPRASVDFVEIDDAVIYAAKNWFCLPERENFHYIQDDGYDFVLNLPAGKVYDYIFLDIYKGKTLPQKFMEESFFRMLKEHVSEVGLVSFNVYPITLIKEQELDRKVKAIFPNVQIDRANCNFDGDCNSAYVHMRKR